MSSHPQRREFLSRRDIQLQKKTMIIEVRRLITVLININNILIFLPMSTSRGSTRTE